MALEKKVFVLFLLCVGLSINPSKACTIFILTDDNSTLFFNNEDWSNPATRIWFIPAGEGFYGAAYLGFDNGWAQGGVNTQGLAYDWVAGFNEQWEDNQGLQKVRGNPSQRMLETCATVEEAIAFFEKNLEPGFSYAKIMIADKSGASVIIGAKENEMQFDRSNKSRGFGYGSKTLNKMLADDPAPDVTSGAVILQACIQEGEYSTKYSNVFNLRSGDISLLKISGQTEEVQLNLHNELKKGAHFFDIPAIQEQIKEAPIVLLTNMKRFPIDEYKPIADKNPAVTKKVAALLRDTAKGALNPKDFTNAFWEAISPIQQSIQADLSQLGLLQSLIPIEGKIGDPENSYRYRIEYETAIVIQLFVLDENNRFSLIKSEASENK